MTASSSTATAESVKRLNRLVVVPSEPIADYEKTGMGWWLKSYYNPAGVFAEVFAVSPRETGRREAHGMTIIGGSPRRLQRLVAELRPDVVRAYGGYWACDFACRHRAGAPVVVSVHDPHPRMVHRSVACADMVICTSDAVEQTVLRRGVQAHRLRSLPNRVDLDVFKPCGDTACFASLKARFGGGRHILHVGRKAPEKNLPAVIEALTHLDQQYKAIFVGRGSNRSYIDLARRLGVSERCFWVESVPNDELPLWYSWCDCMCTPSLWEGFGVVFIEAAASGAAVITSNIAPMNTYLHHRRSALLVDEYRSGAAIAEAIRIACEDVACRTRIRRGAVEAARPFERSRVDAAEAELYRQASAMSPRRVGLALELACRFDLVWRQNMHVARRPLAAVRRIGRRLNGGVGA